MKSDSVRFIVWLTLLLLASFLIHAIIQHKSSVGFYGKQIVLTYTFNYVITIIFFLLMIKFSRKYTERLGFMFLYSSLLKFLLFFLFIYPQFGEFNGVKSWEFSSFFIPYLLSISSEIYYLIRLLNK